MRLAELLGPDVLEIVREDPSALKEGLWDFNPADLSELLDALPREDRVRVLENLSPAQVGSILAFEGGETLKIALTRLSPEALAASLDTLEPDDAARLLSFLSEEKRAPVLNKMTARDAA